MGDRADSGAIPSSRLMVCMTTIKAQPKQTTAFFAQAAISFGVSVLAVVCGIWYLPVETWTRAFLFVGMLYAITSTFTLSKCVRDAQETHSVLSRVDEARLERLLADHDPFKTSI
jgi:hypothetical protein